MPRRICLICDKHASPVKFIGLHLFPQREPARSKWIEVLNLRPDDKFSSVRVCSRHFKPEDFGTLIRNSYRLLPHAFPILRMGAFASASTKTPGDDESSTRHTEMTLKESEHEPEPSVIVESQESLGSDVHLEAGLTKTETPSPEAAVPVVMDIDPPETTQVISSPSTPKRRCFEPRYVSEIETPDVSSPSKARRVIAMAKKQSALQTHKIQSLQSDVRKLSKKIWSLEETVEKLKVKETTPFSNKVDIMALIPVAMRDAVQQAVTGQNKVSPELRSFAMTLHFFSPRAYKYVRQVWGNLLPHPKTVASWNRCAKGNPGYTDEDLLAIKS